MALKVKVKAARLSSSIEDVTLLLGPEIHGLYQFAKVLWDYSLLPLNYI